VKPFAGFTPFSLDGINQDTHNKAQFFAEDVSHKTLYSTAYYAVILIVFIDSRYMQVKLSFALK